MSNPGDGKFNKLQIQGSAGKPPCRRCCAFNLHSSEAALLKIQAKSKPAFKPIAVSRWPPEKRGGKKAGAS
jgi:hypothetical protein